MTEPLATHRPVDLGGRTVVGCEYRWPGGQYCSLNASRGVVGCGIFDIAIANRFGMAFAIARGTPERPLRTPEDLLEARIVEASEAAVALGVTVGMSGREAATLMCGTNAEYSIPVREFGSSGPCLLVTGGVHGDEFEPMAASRRLIGLLERLVDREPTALRGRVVIAPVVNEPAFARGMRTAEDGRDLARTCPGRADGSITERVAFALSRLIRSADYYIDLHTGGTRLQVYPLAGYVLHPDAEVLATQRRMARAFGLPLVWGTDWRLEGRSLSVARDARVPAIYCEYLGGGGCDPAGVTAYVRGCVNVLVELRMIERVVAERLIATAACVEPIIAEDDRPGAGHMQVNLPAPWPGYFEPAVELGQRVTAGQLFGTVVDSIGARRAEVLVPHDGMVIVLHSFARVDASESLGVVLDARTNVTP